MYLSLSLSHPFGKEKLVQKVRLDFSWPFAVKWKFQEKYRDISVTVLNMALESTQYDPNQAEKILNDVKQEMEEIELTKKEKYAIVTNVLSHQVINYTGSLKFFLDASL
jgi:hypothetical protein